MPPSDSTSYSLYQARLHSSCTVLSFRNVHGRSTGLCRHPTTRWTVFEWPFVDIFKLQLTRFKGRHVRLQKEERTYLLIISSRLRYHPKKKPDNLCFTEGVTSDRRNQVCTLFKTFSINSCLLQYFTTFEDTGHNLVAVYSQNCVILQSNTQLILFLDCTSQSSFSSFWFVLERRECFSFVLFLGNREHGYLSSSSCYTFHRILFISCENTHSPKKISHALKKIHYKFCIFCRTCLD